MKQLSLCMILYVVCGLLGLNEIALADSTRRYGCIIDGTDREPTGDRNGRTIVSLQYTCRVADGLLKDAGITGLSVSQWDSEKGRYLASIDIYRALHGIAVVRCWRGPVPLSRRTTGLLASQLPARWCLSSHPDRWRLSQEEP